MQFWYISITLRSNSNIALHPICLQNIAYVICNTAQYSLRVK